MSKEIVNKIVSKDPSVTADIKLAIMDKLDIQYSMNETKDEFKILLSKAKKANKGKSKEDLEKWIDVHAVEYKDKLKAELLETNKDMIIDYKYNMNEAKTKDNFIGKSGKFNWAFKVDGIPGDYPSLPFGHQIDYRKKFKTFKDSAKLVNIGSKGKATLASVKTWIKDNKPSEYYAKWTPDSSSYKDDTIELYYK